MPSPNKYNDHDDLVSEIIAGLFLVGGFLFCAFKFFQAAAAGGFQGY